MMKVYVDDKRALNYFRNLIRKAPKTLKTSSKLIAKDIKRGARQRLTQRRHKSPQLYSKKDWLWKSIGVRPRGGKYKFECWQNPAVAPYGWAIEEGIKGRHFVPQQGKGVYGEGILKPGGQFPKGGAYHFMRDAGVSTNQRSIKIVRREIKKLIGESA